MSSVIDELLYLAEVRDSDVITVPINMGQIISEAIKRVDFMAREFNAEINMPESWPQAIGFGPWIEEVWVNYLNNAINYGGVFPVIQLGSSELPDGKVKFWIKDNGRGISETDRKGLFTRFTLLDKYRKKGHGLRLLIVNRIIDKLGGEVGVESIIGEGSTFHFILSAHEE